MIVYLIKVTLCLGLLLLFYRLFLEREKMHIFNRFYLIAALLFSVITPWVHIPLTQSYTSSSETFSTARPLFETHFQPSDIPPTIIKNEKSDYNYTTQKLLLGAYLAISTLLLLRFTQSVWILLRKKSKNTIIDYHHAKLVLLPDINITYTFLHYIFVNENELRSGQLEDEVLTHELAHASQNHSLDVLFIEILKIIFWINPILSLYKKAIQLNHEFLADDAVLKKYQNIQNYQLLMLNKIQHARQISLSSSFNYSITKKRLSMMKTKSNSTRHALKQVSICILLTLSVIIFSEKTFSQNQSIPFETKNREKQSVKSDNDRKKSLDGKGLNQKELNEFNRTVDEHFIITKKVNNAITFKTPPFNIQEKKRMYLLYNKMTEEQRTSARVLVRESPKPVKSPPSEQMFESWKDPKIFGIWLDGKKVSNRVLDQYKASDIAEWWSSKLYGNARKGRIYKYQLDLSTNSEFKKTYNAWLNDKISILLIK